MTYFRLKVAPAAAAAILALSLSTAFAADDAPAADPAAAEQPAAEEAAPAEAAPADTAAPAEETAAPEAAAPEETPATDAAAPTEEAPADAAAEAPAAEEAAPAAGELSAADLAIGTPVMASDGVQIGEVNRVTSDASGKVSEIHVTAGGPAGLGAKVVAIPADMITSGGTPVKVSISAADAKKLPILDDGKS